MAQVTINKNSLDRLVERLDTLANPTRRRDAEDLGKLVVREMKHDIAALQSPIRGRGKFPALKKGYKERKKRETGRDKPDLDLTGRFLRSLSSKANQVKDGWTTTIGFTSKLSRKKELGHREGANGQAERPIIPNENEGFNRRISQQIRKFFLKRVRDIVSK